MRKAAGQTVREAPRTPRLSGQHGPAFVGLGRGNWTRIFEQEKTKRTEKGERERDTNLLKIKLVGANAVLSWPLNASGFSLQETPSLSAPVWTSTPQPVVDTATEHTVTVSAMGLMKSFRLKHS